MSLVDKLPEGEDGSEILVSTKAVNLLIDKINALIKLNVTPNGVGKLQVADKTAVLDLSGIEQYIYGLVQAANNGGAGGGAGGGGGSGGGTGGNPPGGGDNGGGGGGSGGVLRGPISASGRCLPDGNIEITIRAG